MKKIESAMIFLIICITFIVQTTHVFADSISDTDWSKAYYSFIMNDEYMNDMNGDIRYYTSSDWNPIRFLLFDIGNDGIPELFTNNGGDTHFEIKQYVYTYDDEKKEILYLGNAGLSYGSDFRYISDYRYSGLFCESEATGGVGNCEYHYMIDGIYNVDLILTYNMMDNPMYTSKTQDTHIFDIITRDMAVRNEFDKPKEIVNADLLTKQEISKMGWEQFVTRYLRTPIQNEVHITLNGTDLSFDQPPVIVEDRVLVPLRAIFEAMDATVDWDQDTRTVTSNKGGVTVKFTIGDNAMYKNNQAIALDVPAQVVNNRTLVPIRAVSEAFGSKVSWDNDMRTVVIDSL